MLSVQGINIWIWAVQYFRWEMDQWKMFSEPLIAVPSYRDICPVHLIRGLI